MIVLDTTVLSYADGGEHPLREPCRRLIQAHADGRITAATTLEVIQEFAHVRAHRRSRANAVALARRAMTTFDLVPMLIEDLDLGLALFETLPRLGAFDCVLAAVALNRRAEALVSADRAFGDVPGLAWVDPATPALESLISG
ncbi:MAG TPA: type II toxin-antitoxin system VapC family toxin [Dehalococcoidia bacterium]|nr:type II toxin-antitoxin system VapC family toxin [Dehalococcoidia bacterium]